MRHVLGSVFCLLLAACQAPAPATPAASRDPLQPLGTFQAPQNKEVYQLALFRFGPKDTLALDLAARVLNWEDVTQGLAVGPAYFMLAGKDGKERYASGVKLTADAAGNLVDAHGLLLSPQLQLPAATADVWVREDGLVQVKREGGAAVEEIGVIMVAGFARPTALQAEGDGLFRATAEAGEPIRTRPTVQGFGGIQVYAPSPKP
jgi:hypothetical protein